MAEESRITFLNSNYVGNPVRIGTSRERYEGFLMEGERVRMEFKGMRDALIFTDVRMIVIDPQGIRGRKVALASIPWRSVTAFSVENSGTLDLDTELKVCGSGFDVCEVRFAKSTDMRAVNAFLNERIFRAG